MDYKIFTFIDQVADQYQEAVQITDGLYFDHKDTIRTIEFYTNNKYISGNQDSLGREKPFYNVCNYRVTVAKVATDLDVKDIKYEPDSLKDSVPAMLINRELYKYLKDSNFSLTLNEMGHTRPKYGGVLVKKTDVDGELKIDVVQWKNVDVDPVDILGGVIIETHYMTPAELAAKADPWYDIADVLSAYEELGKQKPSRIEVKEISGEFSDMYYPGNKTGQVQDPTDYRRMCFYVAIVGTKKYLLYFEYEKEPKYKYLAWDAIPGRGLGRGVVEEGFEAQIWTNDSMIARKNALELMGKVVLSTDSQKISGNVITNIDNGHIFQLEPGRSLTSVNLAASRFPELATEIELWRDQYDRVASTYDANTGEAPTAGTPYSQTALLNQVANSPFEYRREEWGIFLNEILNDWVLPHLKKRIIKNHDLVEEYDDDELKLIDEAIHAKEIKKMEIEKIVSGQVPGMEDRMGVASSIDRSLKTQGSKREIEIPEKFLDIDGRITANITGELRNKAATLQSLDSILKTIVSTFNPNTGTYAALQDPVLSKIFGSIVEMSGIPISSAQLKASPMTPSAPTATDLSAISPISNGTPTPTTV